jgi:ribosomal protein S18 acetylase RimI-like enzyme
MNLAMKITAATPADIPGIQALAHAVYRQMYPTLDDATLERRFQRIFAAASLERAITADSAWMLVAREGEQVVGLAHFGSPLMDDCQERKEIFKFYIQPDLQRRGIGTWLLKEIVFRLRQTQVVDECMVYVPEEDTVRLSFYQKNDFRHLATSDRDKEWYLVRSL